MIRKMDMSDVQFVYELEKEAFGKSLEKPMLTKEILYNEMAYYAVLIIDGKRLGYAGLWFTEPNADIINIAVLESKRGQGYGTKLMEHLIQKCVVVNVENISLEVSEAKTDVIRFYESFGFANETRRKQYYSDGSDALLMVKRLGGKL